MQTEKIIFQKGYTHGGIFHLDELACKSMLEIINPEFKTERQQKRFDPIPKEYTNDPYAIVFDVGHGEFDHHDEKTFHKNGVPYAACGKVFDYIRDQLQEATGLSDRGMSEIARFVEAVDAADNGEFIEMDPEKGINDLAAAVKTMTDPKHPENFDIAGKFVKETMIALIEKEKTIDRGETPKLLDREELKKRYFENLEKTNIHMKNKAEGHPTVEDELYLNELNKITSKIGMHSSILTDMLITLPSYEDAIKCMKQLEDKSAKESFVDYQIAKEIKSEDVFYGAVILEKHIDARNPLINDILNKQNILFMVYENIQGDQYNIQPVDMSTIKVPIEWAQDPSLKPESIIFSHNSGLLCATPLPDKNLTKEAQQAQIKATITDIIHQMIPYHEKELMHTINQEGIKFADKAVKGFWKKYPNNTLSEEQITKEIMKAIDEKFEKIKMQITDARVIKKPYNADKIIGGDTKKIDQALLDTMHERASERIREREIGE